MIDNSATLDLVESERNKVIAAMLISGVAPSAIAKELKTTRYFINKLMGTDEFKNHLKEVSESMVATAANSFRAAMSDRVAESMRVIDKHLKEGNLEAVKLVMKAVGIEKTEAVAQQTNLQVILPDYSQPKDVPNETD